MSKRLTPPERSEEEHSQPQTLLPVSAIEGQMREAGRALAGLEARIAELENRQLLDLGTSAAPNGHDRPRPEPDPTNN